MSTNSSLTKGGFTLIRFLQRVASNSKMGHDTNWSRNGGIWFYAKKSLPDKTGEEYLMLNLWLAHSDVTGDWYIFRFSVGYFDKGKGIPSPYPILDGAEVLTHFAKRLAEIEDAWHPEMSKDMQKPTAELWRIHSPANLEALLKEYINLARQRGCIPVFSLYPEDKQN